MAYQVQSQGSGAGSSTPVPILLSHQNPKLHGLGWKRLRFERVSELLLIQAIILRLGLAPISMEPWSYPYFYSICRF